MLFHFGVELQLHFQLVQSQVLFHFGVESPVAFSIGAKPGAVSFWG